MVGNIRRFVPAHILVVVAVVAVISFVGGVFYAYYYETEKIAADVLPTPAFMPPPPPDAPIAPIRPHTPEEEESEERRRESQSVSEPASGPATMGKTIEVGDEFIKLPKDAYIKRHVIFGTCLTDSCPEPPYYVIVLGDAKVILETDGDIWQMTVDENEPDAFDFLRHLNPDSYDLLQANAGVSEDSE